MDLRHNQRGGSTEDGLSHSKKQETPRNFGRTAMSAHGCPHAPNARQLHMFVVTILSVFYA